MKKNIVAIALMVMGSLAGRAQVTLSGKIEFERRVNMHAQLKEMEDAGPNPFMDQMKARMPKFSRSYFDMYFDTSQCLYKPGREGDANPMKMFGGGPATANIVYTNFKSNAVKACKKVFDQSFFVRDSIRITDWRIKDEIRTIAGFKCQKAVGRICDSVYVVAFYTEDIMAAGGPEMFAGLPGMILELAIPRLHTTWTATKVEPILPKAEDFEIAEKGKKVTNKELEQSVGTGFKSFGAMAARNIWWSVL